jgi:integrase
MPLETWPTPDRAAWERATRPAPSPLDDAGPAAALRPKTLRNRQFTWGRFLTFLDRAGELDPAAPPDSRPTPDRIGRWISVLQETQRPTTVQRMLVELSCTIDDLAPGHNWVWIRKHPARPPRAELRRCRRPITPFDAPRLVMEAKAELGTLDAADRTPRTARRARDLTMILPLAYCGLHRGELASLTLGKHVENLDGRYRISLDADEYKTRRPFGTIVAGGMAAMLDRYLAAWRPLLLGDRPDHGAVWVNADGSPTDQLAIYGIVQRTTRRQLAQAVNPHRFRHTMTAGLLLADPFAVRIASAALGHVDTRSVNETYDRAGNAGAQRIWAKLVKATRKGSD